MLDHKVPLVSLADILVLMPQLNPHCYSTSSPAQSSPSTVKITVGRVYNESKDGELIRGVCSNYLADLQPGDTAKVAIKTSTFRPPKSKNAPIIMVSAGTGISPFMGFL
jgi:sulfite reductase alpha subunit-like flavoprotein